MAYWPIVGRELQLKSVRVAADPAGGGTGIVIAGSAGVGKTRLARAALDDLAADPGSSRWVRGTASAQAIPLGAFAYVLPPLAAAKLGHAGLLRAAAAELAAVGDDLLVVVDDAHLLDSLSASLLHHLAHAGTLSLIVTVRSGATPSDAVVALWKDGLLPRLDLEPLSRAETVDLIRTVLGGPADLRTVTKLWDFSQGNPLRLRQLIDIGTAGHALSCRDGMWTWNDTPESPGAGGLERLVADRVTQLEPAVQHLLELLALGEPLAIEVLAQLVPVATLDAAERAGLVTVAVEGRRHQARLAHPLYGTAVLATLRSSARGAHGAELVAVLAREEPTEPSEVIRLALLEIDAGAVDGPRCEAAAAHASASVDHPLAERLAAAAVAAGRGVEARLLLANAILWQGRLTEADRHLDEIEANELSDQQRARVASFHAGLLFWSLDRPDDADAVIRRALAAIADEAAVLDIVGQRSCFQAFRGEVTVAMSSADSVMRSALAPPSAELWAAMGGTLAAGLAGRCERAASMAERGWAAWAASPPDMRQLRAPLGDSACTAFRLAGRLDEARRVADETVAWAAAEDNPMLVAAATALVAQVGLAAADLEGATGLFREANAGLADFDPGGWRYHCYLGLAEASAARGDVGAAAAALSSAHAVLPSVLTVFHPKELLVESAIAAAAGDVDAAVERAFAAAAESRQLGLGAMEAHALHVVLRLAPVSPVAGRLRHLAEVVDGPFAAACAAHVAAITGGSGMALADVARSFERLDLRLAAADVYAHAAGAFTAVGDDRGSIDAASRAHLLLQRCGAARSPAIAALPAPPSLTPREREIAELAGRGASNKTIAATLGVSVRTVEGHLSLVYAKLAIHRRADLAAALPLHPEPQATR